MMRMLPTIAPVIVLLLIGVPTAALPQCLDIPLASIVLECDSLGSGQFTYTFNITNSSSETVHHVYLLGGWPATFTPNHFSLASNPLAPDSTTGLLTTLISFVDPDSSVCFRVSVHDSLLEECCSIENCVISPCSETATGIPELPARAVPYLEPNWPNPFNPTTHVGFWLPAKGFVVLRVYDVHGRRVSTMLSEFRRRGYHTVRWDANDSDGRALVSGVYFCRLEFGSGVQTQKMTLMK